MSTRGVWVDLSGLSGAEIRTILSDSNSFWGRMFGWMVDGQASGINLAAIRAFNSAIRAENIGARQQCWGEGHFVGVTGKCVADREEGIEKALRQLNGDTPFDPDGLRKTRLEGYLASKFYEDWATAVDSEDGTQIQDVINKYGQYSDVMSSNPYIGGNSFSLMNPQNVLDRMILGDGDIGVTVQMCTSTVTTNCVDPKAINDIWEDFGRHVQVIFKGLEIPGLPEWLPLPGIMRLPTIGEIWDKVSGPFNDAAKEQMQECMSQDDDGDGVNNTASYCYENRNIAGIITDGILTGAGDVVDATIDKVGEIVDKALEPLDCLSDPASCAGEIKDVIEGVFGGADPTQPGLPDWMRVIIVGGQYGDEILRELEKIFDNDINGDGTIGVTDPNTFDCSSIGKSGGMVPDASYCGDCSDANQNDFGNGCEPVCQYNNAIPASSSECVAPAEFDCATVGKQGGLVQSEDQCGACLQGYDEIDGQCQEIEDPITNQGPTASECAAEHREFNKATDVADSSCGPCLSGWKEEGGVCVKDTGGPDDGTGPDCTQPKPAGFDGVSWQYACGDTHCTDGSLISDHPNNDCSIPIGDDAGSGECPNGATNYPECDQCPQGQSLVDGQCTGIATPECDQQDRVTNADGSCGECKPGFTPDPEGFDQCIQAPPECNDCSCEQYAADNPVECGTDTEEPGPDGGDAGGGGGGGGGGMFTGAAPVDLSFDIAGDPTLLARSKFPITDFLAGIFTNSRGGRNV